ncbi:MAG: hypothetical protein HDT30_11460 [Clostridiales bacterium]|nr:hypothetical protein [Clostridiales bacterium]
MSLIAPVEKDENGGYKVADTSISTTKKETKGTGTLGKEAFLQLLVAQMQYQDPLNPSSDTEWVSQMAQFSALEQMQNMNATITNSQAFSLIGQTVEVTTEDGNIEGVVDYVNISDGTAYVSIDGKTYESSKVNSVLSSGYIQQKYAPKVPKQTITYDYDDRTSAKISVSLGSKEYAANGMYVAIGDQLIDSDYLSYDKEKEILTIYKDAFYGLTSGKTYDISFSFDDAANTTITETVSLKVTGNQPADTLEENTEE